MTPNNEAKVTERPWKTGPEVPYVKGINLWRGSLYIGNIKGDRSLPDPDETARANAAFIVKAVNAHDALLAIAKKWRDEIMDDAPDDLGVFQIEILKEIEQAVALAEGRPE